MARRPSATECARPTERIVGLDCARAIAIIGVLVSHSTLPFGELSFPAIKAHGALGVDLFFALSGWLIGGQLFNQLNRGTLSVTGFWRRRWLRTVPAYAAWLAINLVADEFLLNRPDQPFPWRYLLYVQNLWTRHPPFFGEAWSLAVEEWFYLLTPLALAAFSVRLKPIRSMAAAIALLALIPIVARVTASSLPPVDAKFILEQCVVFRLDAIAFGVAAVVLERTGRFDSPTVRRRLVWLGCLLLAARFSTTVFPDFESTEPIMENRWIQAWSTVLGPAGAALLLPSLSRIRALPWPRVQRAATFIALISYSIYLSNGLLLQGFGGVARRFDLPMSPVLVAWLMVTLTVSWLSYRWIEQPFIRLYRRPVKLGPVPAAN